jgi:hypothetical protein
MSSAAITVAQSGTGVSGWQVRAVSIFSGERIEMTEEQTVERLETYVGLALKAKAGIKLYSESAFAYVTDALWDVLNIAVVSILRHHLYKVKLKLDPAQWRTQEWEGHSTLLLVDCGIQTLSIPVSVLRRTDRKLSKQIGRLMMNQVRDNKVIHQFAVKELLAMDLPTALRHALETVSAEVVIIRYSNIANSGVFLIQEKAWYTVGFTYHVPEHEVDFVEKLLAKREVAPYFYLKGRDTYPSGSQKDSALEKADSIRLIEISGSNLSYQVMRALEEYPDVMAFFGWQAIYAHPRSDQMYMVHYGGGLTQPWHAWPEEDRYGLTFADFSKGPVTDSFWILDRYNGMETVSARFPMMDFYGMENIFKILRLWNSRGPEFVFRHILWALNHLEEGSDEYYNALLIKAFWGRDQTFLDLTVHNDLTAVDQKGEVYLSTHHGYAFQVGAGWWNGTASPWIRLLSCHDFCFETPNGDYVPLLVLVAAGDVTLEDAAKYVALTKGIQITERREAGYGYSPRYAFTGETEVFEYLGQFWKARGTGQRGDVVEGIEVQIVKK